MVRVVQVCSTFFLMFMALIANINLIGRFAMTVKRRVSVNHILDTKRDEEKETIRIILQHSSHIFAQAKSGMMSVLYFINISNNLLTHLKVKFTILEQTFRHKSLACS
jgi:hypothetical protein